MNEWADWQKVKKINILISELINNKYIDEIKNFKKEEPNVLMEKKNSEEGKSAVLSRRKSGLERR
ncbi:MAG: hypothetical protein H5U07_06265 [Candidatus Aminicenantes bacterium]|nr:hypothetical protein [Candidatus Aminicenantes bacterium]